MKEKTAKRMKRLGITILTLSIIYAAALIYANIQLRSAQRALVMDGYPMKAEEIIPPPVADSDNAALLYQAAELMLKATPAGETSLYEAISKTSAEFHKDPNNKTFETEVARLLELPETQSALSLIKQGTQRPACRYDLDYENPLSTSLQHLSSLVTENSLLRSNALLMSKKGNNIQAWQTMITALKHANALETEPILISQLVRISQFNACYTTMQQLPKPPTELMSEIGACIAPLDKEDKLAEVINAERILIGDIIFSGKKYSSSDLAAADVPSAFAFYLSKANPLLRLDHAAYTRFAHAHAKNCTSSHSQQDYDHLIPPYCIMSRLLLPAYGTVTEKFHDHTAQSRIARATLKLQQYHNKNGSYPKALSELTGLNTTDPFTGKQLIYKPTETEFILYSVGRNLKDDNGVDTGKKETSDIITCIQ